MPTALSKTKYFDRYSKNVDVTSVTEFAYSSKILLQMLLLLQLF